jgi:hypothetical protein
LQDAAAEARNSVCHSLSIMSKTNFNTLSLARFTLCGLVLLALPSCASKPDTRPKTAQESEQAAIEHKVFYSGWGWSGR